MAASLTTVSLQDSTGAALPFAVLDESGTGAGPFHFVPLASLAAVRSTTAESNHVLKGSAGSLYSLAVTIGATSGWLLLFNATSAPADGAVTPVFWLPLTSNGANGYGTIEWRMPLQFSTGITAVFSTTGPFTKTASATAAFSAQVV